MNIQVYGADIEPEKLEVHYIDVGQGDCTLLKCAGEAMLIDAGDETSGYQIANYLRLNGVNRLKYMILTHPDADHVGGADTVMYMLDGVDCVIKDNLGKNTVAYREVEDMVKYLGITVERPQYGRRYTLGGSTFAFLEVAQYGDEENNNSIVTSVDYAHNSFLFTGDAMEAEELAIVNNKTNLYCDVLKAGHHGSKNSTTMTFLKAVAPKYAVISCGEGNSYGHPHADTLRRLRDQRIHMFRTDEQGTIVAVSDGNNITWSQPASECWLAGSNFTNRNSPKAITPGNNNDTANIGGRKEDGTANPYNATYVANTRSMKFHHPKCPNVRQMKEKNKMNFIGDRQDLIDQGYEPCKGCNP